MKTPLLLLILLCPLLLLVQSCQKNETSTPGTQEDIPKTVLTAVKDLGFSTEGIRKRGTGYIVEGDIYISADELGKKWAGTTLRAGEVEQYRTNELVTGWPRVIRIFVSGLGSQYEQATDEAIKRYNDLRLGLTFSRIGTSADADITIYPYYEVSSTNGYSGFPTAGNPYHSIYLNTYRFFRGANTILWATSVIQHEIGHCIGMRHTDYMGTTSCGNNWNEGDAGVGAIYIPGTSTLQEQESWMLACIPEGRDRSFSTADILALGYLYAPNHIPPPQLFYEFYHGPTSDHALSTNYNLPYIYGGWRYNDVSHRIYLVEVPGTVPLYQFFHGPNGDHLYTTNRNEVIGDSNWWYSGIFGYVHATQVPGTVPVKVYFNSRVFDRVTTTKNISLQYPDYPYIGVAYYAFPI